MKIHEEAKRANVFKEVHLSFGDLEAGFAAADHTRDDWYFFEGNTHAAIEAHSAVASYDGDGKLSLWTSTQVPHYLHRELEKVLGLPRSRIRVIATPNGGAFGGKSDPFAHEFAACLLSMRTKRPVKFTLDREEVFYAHRGRHPVKMRLRAGVTKDGEFTAAHLQTWLDGGAYASYGIATTGSMNGGPLAEIIAPCKGLEDDVVAGASVVFGEQQNDILKNLWEHALAYANEGDRTKPPGQEAPERTRIPHICDVVRKNER